MSRGLDPWFVNQRGCIAVRSMRVIARGTSVV